MVPTGSARTRAAAAAVDVGADAAEVDRPAIVRRRDGHELPVDAEIGRGDSGGRGDRREAGAVSAVRPAGDGGEARLAAARRR